MNQKGRLSKHFIAYPFCNNCCACDTEYMLFVSVGWPISLHDACDHDGLCHSSPPAIPSPVDIAVVLCAFQNVNMIESVHSCCVIHGYCSAGVSIEGLHVRCTYCVFHVQLQQQLRRIWLYRRLPGHHTFLCHVIDPSRTFISSPSDCVIVQASSKQVPSLPFN